MDAVNYPCVGHTIELGSDLTAFSLQTKRKVIYATGLSAQSIE